MIDFNSFLLFLICVVLFDKDEHKEFEYEDEYNFVLHYPKHEILLQKYKNKISKIIFENTFVFFFFFTFFLRQIRFQKKKIKYFLI